MNSRSCKAGFVKKPTWVAPQEKKLLSLFSDQTVGKWGFFVCAKQKDFAPKANKSFRPPFSKGGGVQRRSLWSHSAECESPYRQAHFRGFGPLLQVKRGPRTDCNHKLSLKNYPVDDF